MLRISAFIFLVLFEFVANQSVANNYGPYKFEWVQIGTCKGPKSGNCGEFQMENTQDPTDIIFRFNILNDCLVTGAKIEVGNNQNNSSKKLWNYVINKPCQHFVLGPVFKDAFNVTSSCKINKGIYNIHINLEEKSKVFLGSNFFYGSYAFKVTSFNKANNLFCMRTLLDVLKTT